ncbi:hypothetical protein [Pseudomonas aeruginosa]|uniref:hypothetical protein n=1 Tax=Pseudomonas aeruginosa TaxID=287 RepID=UPI0018726923|nr:hypothetical protein [Pseudomonas aeruginosa]HBO1957499.1 hypothetical protein [Pseudomonas aeruginosa]
MSDAPSIRDSSGKVVPDHPSWRGRGDPPGEDELNTRIINLERDMTDVKVAIGKVETRLENIERNMVTKGQLAVYALLGLMAMVGAGWWVVQQYLAPILVAIGKIPA